MAHERDGLASAGVFFELRTALMGSISTLFPGEYCQREDYLSDDWYDAKQRDLVV